MHRHVALVTAAAALATLALPACAVVTFYDSLAAFQSAAATSVLVTFDPFSPVGDEVPPAMTLGGIDIHAIDSDPLPPNLFVAPPTQTNFGAPRDSNVLTSSGNEHFSLTFHVPRQAFGFDLYTNDGVAPVLTVYSPSGTSLGEHVSTLSPDSAGFLGFVADTAVGWVEYKAFNGQHTNTGLDNLRASLPGDANLNGRIDPDDFALLDRGAAKSLVGYANGDFTGDGQVDAGDRQIIDTSFQQQSGTFPPALIPEPLLCPGLLIFLTQRPRRPR